MGSATLDSSPVYLALQHSRVPILKRIRIEESETQVVLTGIVPSYYLKQLAQETVLPLLAGRKLCNLLDVVRDLPVALGE
jgi:hypothetical protein